MSLEATVVGDEFDEVTNDNGSTAMDNNNYHDLIVKEEDSEKNCVVILKCKCTGMVKSCRCANGRKNKVNVVKKEDEVTL